MTFDNIDAKVYILLDNFRAGYQYNCLYYDFSYVAERAHFCKLANCPAGCTGDIHQCERTLQEIEKIKGIGNKAIGG